MFLENKLKRLNLENNPTNRYNKETLIEINEPVQKKPETLWKKDNTVAINITYMIDATPSSLNSCPVSIEHTGPLTYDH